MPTSKDLTDLESQVKKSKISAASFKSKSSLGSGQEILNIHKTIGNLAGHVRKTAIRVGALEKIVNNQSKKITSLKNISGLQGQQNKGTNLGAKLPGSSADNLNQTIVTIADTISSIAETLKAQKKTSGAASENERKRAEREKRGLAESKLEKVFSGIINTAQKIIAPVKSLLDRILEFIGTVILGRIVYKLVGWLGDSKNKDKVKSIIRFFKDWGPTLLSLYIVFGTSFGKFARGLISLVIKSAIRLGAAVAALAVKAGIGKAGGRLSKVAGFLGGKKGKLFGAVLETGVTIAGTMALSNTLKGGDKEPDQPKAQGLAGGGRVRPKFPAFAGGGFNFKGMMGGAAMGGMFGPLGMLLGGAFGSGKPQQMVNGFVSGQKGVDKVPAMLSDGEFVMSRGAVQKYGVDTLEGMNAAGGGTNRPKIISGKTYAAGGGMIGGSGSGRPEYRERYDKTHGAGAYDKELARRRAITDAQDNADIALRRNLQRGQTLPTQPTQKTASGNRKITVNGINVTGLSGLAGSFKGMGPNVTITRDNQMTPEMQAKLAAENKKSAAMDASRATQAELRKKARAEYNKIINNPNDPRYQDAWDGKIKISDLQKQLQSTSPAAPPAAKPAAATPAAATPAAPTAKPAAAGAAAPAQGIGNAYNPMNWFQPGGTFGGPRMKARTDYAAGKGKYYSSSDQKTYGNYNDAMAAKKSRMTSLASQQRLDKLSSKGAGPKTGRGIRYTTENLARSKEYEKRGGLLGQMGRGLTSMFGTGAQIAKNTAADKASDARVKQSGAASIGRYYSSSDGKYYKDYNAAMQAKKIRLAKQQKKPGAVKPPVKPKPTAAGGKGGGGGGYSANKGPKGGPKTPSFSATTKGSRTKADLMGVHR